MKRQKRSINFSRIVLAVVGLFMVFWSIGTLITAYDDWKNPVDIIEYHKTVEPGETLWGICEEIATSKEDLRRIVHQAMADNGIVDPTVLQPGRVVIVRVKEARGK